ncbi:MAG: T9SS type A sorting domain-containing protein [Dysgonamonadaceae bacterium]|jgi:hypothetical protein|nr:T9SS type A sorting domain-containing protein [Dysgonamonadaceae bacterium]
MRRIFNLQVISFAVLSFFTLNVPCVYGELHCFLPRTNGVISITDKKYLFEGDTIIDNMRYTKVYIQDCTSETDCWEWDYFAAVREDTVGAKIYVQVPDHPELLLADFDVKAGDEITVYNLFGCHYFFPDCYPEPIPVKVESVDSILIDNQYRKRVNFNHPWDWYGNESWVEGIGDINCGLFFTGGALVADGGDVTFLCLSEDDVLIYKNPGYETCYLKDSSVAIDEIETFPDIFPNPVNEIIYIKFSEAFSYIIFDSNGNVALSGVLQNSEIDVSSLKRNIYVLSLYDRTNKTVQTNKFIKR